MAQRQAFRITDFRGGLNPDQNAHTLADNEAVEVLNFRLDKDGSLVSRNGYDNYLSLTHSADLVAIGRWSDGKVDPTTELLAMDDAGKLLKWNPVGPAIDTLLDTGVASNVRGQFLQVENKVLYVNGAQAPIWYDGTTAAPLGVAAPSAAPTVAVVAPGAGGITGDYQYVYTYYDSTYGWESNPSSASATAVATNDDIEVGVVASTDPEVDQIKIYRTTDGGATFLYLATISNATTTYTDNGTDTLTAIEVSYLNGTPEDFEHIAYHKGYLFGSIGDTLYWSNALDIHGWSALNSTDVPFEGTDEIVALVSHQDTLLIFGSKNVLTLAGNSGNWTLIRQDVSLGALSHTAIVEVFGQVLFLTREGIYTFPGFSLFAPKLTRQISSLNENGLSSASLIHVPDQKSIWLALNDQVWVITLPNQTLSRYNFYGSYFLGGGEDGLSYPIWIQATNYTDTSRTKLMQYGGYDDEGADITVSWKSKIFQLANPEATKFFRRLGAFASSGSGASVTITINDQENPPYSVSLSSAAAGAAESVWGTAVWDTALWSFEGLAYFIGALPAQTLIGRTFQVAINADVNVRTEIIPPITFQYREANRFLGV